MNIYSASYSDYSFIIWNVLNVISFCFMLRQLIQSWIQTGNSIKSCCGTICPFALFLITVITVIGLTYSYIPPAVIFLSLWLSLKTQSIPQDVHINNWDVETIENDKKNYIRTRKELIESSLITRTLLEIKERSDKDLKKTTVGKLKKALSNRPKRAISTIFSKFIFESKNKSYRYSDGLQKVSTECRDQENISQPAKDTAESDSCCACGGQKEETDLDNEDDHNFRIQDEECSICLCEYEAGDQVSWSRNIKCPHVFHYECIKPWLMEQSECPICRSDLLKTKEMDKKDIEMV